MDQPTEAHHHIVIQYNISLKLVTDSISSVATIAANLLVGQLGLQATHYFNRQRWTDE